jgi:hypothetical protein
MSILDEDVKRASGTPSTSDGMDMLDIDHKPQHNYAGNTYLTALREISKLRAKLAALLVVAEAAKPFKAAYDNVFHEYASGESVDAFDEIYVKHLEAIASALAEYQKLKG